ncbi:MAG: Spore photoproduct lyase, partial [uncultured Frankineae bacterium]
DHGPGVDRDGRDAARRPQDLRRAGGCRAAAGSGGARPLAGRRTGGGRLPLAHPGAGGRRGERPALGADQDRGARPGRQEVARRTAERPLLRLHRAVDGQRVRHGLRLLLRAAPQGLLQPGDGVRQHRADPALHGAPRRPPGTQVDAGPGRPVGVGLRHRGEQRLLRGRPAVGQRPRPRRAVPRPADRQGVVRHQARQPRPALLGPAGPHPCAVLAHARRRLPPARHPHRPDRRPHRGPRRLRRGGVRGARQPLARRRPGGLARRLGPAARRPRRGHGRGVQGTGGRGGHLPHPQRAAARGQPRLAPAGRAAAVDTADPAGQAVADRRPQRALPHRVQGRAGARAHRPDRRAHPVVARPVRLL